MRKVALVLAVLLAAGFVSNAAFAGQGGKGNGFGAGIGDGQGLGPATGGADRSPLGSCWYPRAVMQDLNADAL